MGKTRVAVFFGGVSSEHEVSLKSATSVIRNMDKEKYHIVKIGITKKGNWLYYPGDVDMIENGTWENHPDCVPAVFSPDRGGNKGIVKLMDDGSYALSRVDVAFPVLHGRGGEDGTIQGLFALAGIPFVGCDMLSCADCMDKAVTKILLTDAGIPNTPWRLVTPEDMGDFATVVRDCSEKFGWPVFVKPCNAGSSVGVNRAANDTELKDAINMAFTHDRRVLIEKCINAREIECAVLGNQELIVSTPGEIVPMDGFYDYEAKYISGTSQLLIPAPLTEEQTELIRETAYRAYRALGCQGFSRVDFFIDKDGGQILLNEINTIPGFTSISMYPKMIAAAGIPYGALIDRLIDLALERAE